MATKLATKRNLAICLVISALMHLIAGAFVPTNMSSTFGIKNQRMELSWRMSEPLPASADNFKNSPPDAEKKETSLPWNPEKHLSPSNRETVSEALTKRPEMLSEELLFVETDFGYQAAGSITVTLTIGKEGSVKKISKTMSTTRPMFEDQVIKHLLKSTWSPAEINGSPVESTITITIDIGG